MTHVPAPRLLRVASYNIHRGQGGDGDENLDRIAGVLGEIDADIIALQEVGYKTRPRKDVAGYLADALGAAAIPGITFSDDSGDYGNALLTRFPVTDVCRHDISVTGREPRGAIQARLQAGQEQIRVIATHLGLRRQERSVQVETLLTLLTQNPAGVDVLLGDFNEWFRYSRLLGKIDAALGVSGAPATFPAKHPLLALDRIWVRPAASVAHISGHRSTLSRLASDHLPLVAELALPPAST